VNPWTKFFEIITVSLIVVLFTDLRFTSLHGFLGITEIPLWVSVVLTVFLMVLIINSVNLIDGIDGLAASIGIIASVSFGLFFWLSGDYGYAVMSAALTGSLVAFLPYNFSKSEKKIFMGDTGSLAIGFLLTIFAIRFNELDAANKTWYDFLSAPTVSIAVLIIPLFDTLRIIVLRFYHKKSLFEADNRHIHHLMLEAGFSHGTTTLLLSMFNLVIILVAVLFDHLGILWLGLLLLMICISGNEVVRYYIRSRRLKHPAT
jgi:UDP-N-acetylmuramyl pentapeptide phosphotransferase/UDP-N-acetylglucosamine-1-phosphate transferase